MAKRAAMNMGSMLASKEVSAVITSTAPATVDDTVAIKRGRGRPPKGAQPVSAARTYGQTIRMTPGLRKALREAADAETDAQGRVVSVHDVILEAVRRHLTRKGIEVKE